jgi:hypothetical protein
MGTQRMSHGAATVPASSRSATKARETGLTRSDFFADVVERLRAALPAELADFQSKTTMSLLKVYYGNERVHYEVWANGSQRTLEIGLHFEDGPISTSAYLAHFDRMIVELKHHLGPDVELERWTSTWGHLYEVAPLTNLTPALVAQTVSRLGALISTLQPLVEAAAVAPERSSVANEPRGPWRKWRRGGH